MFRKHLGYLEFFSIFRGAKQDSGKVFRRFYVIFVARPTLGILKKNSSYLHTKQRPLWLHVSFFTHFNKSLTINNIAALTRADTKNPHISVIQFHNEGRSVRSNSVLFFVISDFSIVANWMLSVQREWSLQRDKLKFSGQILINEPSDID